MNIIDAPNGLTIKQLKDLVRDLPEENEFGEPYEVWVETGHGLSSPVISVWPLNTRGTGCDLILNHAIWNKDEHSWR